MILIQITKTDSGFRAFRFTTKEVGTIERENIPKKVLKMVETEGRARAVVANKAMKSFK